MNSDLARKVADAVLYEGYMLYPYRPSAIKNRQRWTFGILYPPNYDEVRAGTERAGMHSECLLVNRGSAALHLQLRFLHLLARQVMAAPENGAAAPVPSLTVDGQVVESWDDAVERSAEFEFIALDGPPRRFEFSFPGSCETESLRNEAGCVVGSVSRMQHEVKGTIGCRSEKISDQVLKLVVDVANESSLPPGGGRDDALLRSLLSAHTILTVSVGEFVSLLEPPEDLRATVNTCHNVGNFPVLVGEPGSRDMLLCSPIVLYDYPQIAPESAGDFYDATEIDEMLTLRVLSLTEEEKAEMRKAGERGRNLLQRTEDTARAQLERTHGAIRNLRPVRESHE